MLRIPYPRPTVLRRWIALASIVLPLTATAQLRVVCEINGSVYPLASVEGDQLMVAKDDQSFRAPRDATWRLEGDVRRHAEYFLWAPWYSITRTIGDELAVAPGKPFKGTILVSGPYFYRQEGLDPNIPLNDWPAESLKGAAAIALWLVDGKATDLEVVALQATGKGAAWDLTAHFRLPPDAVRGQPALLLWTDGGFVAPLPLFEDPIDQQALVAVLLDDKEVSASMPARPNPGAISLDDKPLINYAAEAGAANALSLLLEQNRRAARITDDHGATPLHLAARLGRERAVELLLQAGAVVNARTKRGETALSEAVGSGSLPVVRRLLEARALPKNKTDRSSLLRVAIASGFADVAEMLKDAGAIYDFGAIEGVTTLIKQARDGHWEMVLWLAENGVSVDEPQAGQTALLATARTGSRDLAETLIAAGADPNKSNITGFAPLTAAAEGGNIGFASVLLEAGADANAQSESGATVLQIAAQQDAAAIVTMLLDAGADIEARNDQNFSALDAALLNGAGDAARELARRGATIDLGSSHSQTLLEAALRWDIPEPLDGALQAGWPPNSTFAGVWPALRLAQLFGATRCEALLAAAGAEADPDQPTPVVPAADLDERLKIVRAVMPEDPRSAAESFSDAFVRVEFILDSEGRPLFPKVSDSPDQRLASAALAVVEQWRFTPPRHNGQAVASKVLLPIKFPAAAEQIFAFEELGTMPVPISRVTPAYPLSLKVSRIEGSVALIFVILSDGTVRDVEVESSSDPRFGAAAVDAAYQWKFKAGTIAGRPVATRIRQRITFQLPP